MGYLYNSPESFSPLQDFPSVFPNGDELEGITVQVDGEFENPFYTETSITLCEHVVRNFSIMYIHRSSLNLHTHHILHYILTQSFISNNLYLSFLTKSPFSSFVIFYHSSGEAVVEGQHAAPAILRVMDGTGSNSPLLPGILQSPSIALRLPIYCI